MAAIFTARPSVLGRRVELAIDLPREFAAAPPGLRVLRQRDNNPVSPTPGFILFDAQRQFDDLSAPAPYARRIRGITKGGVTDAGMWEFDLWEARTGAPGLATHPTAVHVDLWEGTTLKSFRLVGVTAVAVVIDTQGSVTKVITTYTAGQQTAKATVTTTVGQTARKFTWTDIGGGNHDVFYDIEEDWQAQLSLTPLGAGPNNYDGTFAWKRDGVTVLAGTLRSTIDTTQGGWRLTVTLDDEVPSEVGGPPGLASNGYYYYGLYVDEVFGNGGPVYAPTDLPAGVASALPTGRYGESERLYNALPAIHRNYDEPDANDQGNGQLRRFVSITGTVHDHARGFADGLALRNDPLHCEISVLPSLAHSVGWDIDRTNPGELQRNDILFATEVFESVGTLPNLALLISRATQKAFKIHEYVNNVFVTNGGPNYQWDIWHGTSGDGQTFGPSDIYANPHPTRVPGRFAPVLSGGSQQWLFWHEASSGRRELWMRWPLQNFAARTVMAGAVDDIEGISYTDENVCAVAEPGNLRLFWSSNRGGAWNIWTRTLPNNWDGIAPLVASPPEQVTFHAAEDRYPTAVLEPGVGGRLWLFWSSNRRGTFDIWGQAASKVGGAWKWGAPRRITAAAVGDHMPSAMIDINNKVHLFWSALSSEGARLFEATLGVGQPEDAWSVASKVGIGETQTFRDEAPCAVNFQGLLWLYWQSNRTGRWQIWRRSYSNGIWNTAQRVVQSFVGNQPEPKNMIRAKEPAVINIAGTLYMYWRSQLAGEKFQSRTWDTNNSAMFAAKQTITDWVHYTYDSGQDLGDWYSYDTVGVHFTDALEQGDACELPRVRAFVESYRPATVRIVWFEDMAPKP